MPPTASSAPDHIPYKITSQQKAQTFTEDGRFVTVWRVGFRGPNGYHAYVEIPDEEYTPANVDRIIEEQLDTIVGVHALGEEPHPDNLASGDE